MKPFVFKTKKRKYRKKYTIKEKGGSIFDSVINMISGPSTRKSTEYSQKILPCSPSIEHQKKIHNIHSRSCLLPPILFMLRDSWNMQHPHDQISAIHTSPDSIHSMLEKKMEPTCKNELCWLDTLGVSNKEKIEYFVPTRPRKWETNINEWLSNVDIIKVLTQYEDAYPYFKYIPPTPIDFDKRIGKNTCVEPLLCDFQLALYHSNRYSKIGMVFNTDEHTKSGSHWISLFVDIPKELIFFFDSAGDPCPSEIKTLVSRIITQGKDIGVPFTFDQNAPMTHQHSTTECGIYSLYFIINMLKDIITPTMLKTVRIPDKEMVRLRDIYFRPAFQ